jgi:hypothetical protein
VRTSILAWSVASGVLLGVFADVILAAVVVLAARLLPTGAARWLQRLGPVAWTVALIVLPAIGAVLGYLEGQLKTR